MRRFYDKDDLGENSHDRNLFVLDHRLNLPTNLYIEYRTRWCRSTIQGSFSGLSLVFTLLMKRLQKQRVTSIYVVDRAGNHNTLELNRLQMNRYGCNHINPCSCRLYNVGIWGRMTSTKSVDDFALGVEVWVFSCH